MSPKQVKLILSVGAVILFVLLFIAPKVGNSGQKSSMSMGQGKPAPINANANVEMYLNMANGSLSTELRTLADNFIKQSVKDPVFFDSIAKFWDQQKRPDLASHYLEKKALRTNTAKDWFLAGNRYYYSIQFIRDETERPVLYQCAIRSFKNGLKLEPNNNDSKIMLASCFVEGTDSPMEGISLLKEVERNDSNNVKLQVTFAFFSVKSGQMDKAITRFNKVLELDPDYIEAYLHLADIYEQMNNLDKTVEALEKYAARTNDPTAKLEVEKYIKQLKSK